MQAARTIVRLCRQARHASRLLAVHMAPAPATSTAIMESQRLPLYGSTMVRSLSKAAADAGTAEEGVSDGIRV